MGKKRTKAKAATPLLSRDTKRPLLLPHNELGRNHLATIKQLVKGTYGTT